MVNEEYQERAKAISIYDDEQSLDEDRWITIGKDQTNLILVVIHTFREENIANCRIRVLSKDGFGHLGRPMPVDMKEGKIFIACEPYARQIPKIPNGLKQHQFESDLLPWR